MKTENALEPIYIFTKLYQDNAFEFVASQHELLPDCKYGSADLTLLNDIFPNSGSNIINEFTQETTTSLANITAIDREMTKKLEAYKSNHYT